MHENAGAELARVLSHYDLGELVSLLRDQRGTVNVSYVIETVRAGRRQKFFLRRYKRGARREELLFEHSLIDHIAEQSECPVARPRPTRGGETFVHLPREEDDSGGAFYAVFDLLPGQDRYTWVGPRLSRPELRNAGALLGRFHAAASTLSPPGRRAEPKIGELLGVIEAQWSEGKASSRGSVFDLFLERNFDLVRTVIRETRAALAKAGARHLPEVIIHCDYHPGNLMFEGDEITGLVDFDWSKVDLRAFDVALAVWYFCASWEGASDGRLRLGEARAFLAAYQGALARSALPPLSATEMRHLPTLLMAGNLYVLYWALRDYFGKDVDPDEYLTYLKHNVAFMRWLSSATNRAGLRRMLAGVPRPAPRRLPLRDV